MFEKAAQISLTIKFRINHLPYNVVLANLSIKLYLKSKWQRLIFWVKQTFQANLQIFFVFHEIWNQTLKKSRHASFLASLWVGWVAFTFLFISLRNWLVFKTVFLSLYTFMPHSNTSKILNVHLILNIPYLRKSQSQSAVV